MNTQLIIFDVCHSGGAIQEFSSGGTIEEKAIMDLSKSAGCFVLATSGTEKTSSDFKDLGHGVFTYALLEGLSGRSDGGGGKITDKELDSYINDKVPELQQKYRVKKQCSNSGLLEMISQWL